jgi:hypothetical protein
MVVSSFRAIGVCLQQLFYYDAVRDLIVIVYKKAKNLSALHPRRDM